MEKKRETADILIGYYNGIRKEAENIDIGENPYSYRNYPDYEQFTRSIASLGIFDEYDIAGFCTLNAGTIEWYDGDMSNPTTGLEGYEMRNAMRNREGEADMDRLALMVDTFNYECPEEGTLYDALCAMDKVTEDMKELGHQGFLQEHSHSDYDDEDYGDQDYDDEDYSYD